MSFADPIRLDLYIAQASEYDVDGHLRVQGDTYGEEGSESIEVFPAGGTRFRPRSPDPSTGTGCPFISGYDGGKAFAMPGLDTRAAVKLYEQPEGSFLAYGDTGEPVLPVLSIDGESGLIELKRDDATEIIVDKGRISLYTTEDKTPTGRPVFFYVQETGFFWESPYGRAKLDATGFHVKEHGGARLDIGSMGMPAPLDSIGSYATLQAAMVTLRSGLIALGPDTLPKDAVALTGPILAFAAALSTFLTSLVSATAAGIASAGPGGAGASAGFTSAMSNALGLLGGAVTTLTQTAGSKSTSSA